MTPLRPLLAAVCLTLTACGAARWSVKETRDDFELPRRITIYVAMSDEVAQQDSGLALAVVDALAADLAERGYTAPVEVHRAGETPPVPRIELQIVDSQGGNSALRGAGALGGMVGSPVGGVFAIAGLSRIVVDCHVVLERGPNPGFKGRIEAGTYRGLTGHDAIEAGERVGLNVSALPTGAESTYGPSHPRGRETEQAVPSRRRGCPREAGVLRI